MVCDVKSTHRTNCREGRSGQRKKTRETRSGEHPPQGSIKEEGIYKMKPTTKRDAGKMGRKMASMKLSTKVLYRP